LRANHRHSDARRNGDGEAQDESHLSYFPPSGLIARPGCFECSRGVAQRTREIGVRVALGADRRDVSWLILRQGLGLTAIGLGVGLPLAYGAGRVLAQQLVGISAGDPLSFAGMAVLLFCVAAAASALPARRAASLDPLAALRSD
jgi:ABC-type antimicrobial peptide transport system permease subunit